MAEKDAKRAPAQDKAGWWWVIGVPSDESGWLPVQGRTGRGVDLRSLDIRVRVAQSPKGRLFVTGLRIGALDGKPEYEIKSLRDIHLGEILALIREAASLGDGKALGPTLRGNVKPADLTVRRGPKPDIQTDERTLELYEAKPDAGLSKTNALAETAKETYRSESQVYRRLARARQARERRGTE